MDQPASPIDRRCFIKWSLLVGSSVASLPAFGLEAIGSASGAPGTLQAGTRILRAGCPSHNCGGSAEFCELLQKTVLRSSVRTYRR